MAENEHDGTETSRPNVVITGTSSGIGRATAVALAEAGYRVFAGVRRLSDGDALIASAGPGSGQIVPVVVDVTDAESVAAAATTVANTVGQAGIDALVNNAGIGVTGPLECVRLDDLRRIFEVNVFGQIAVTQQFLPLLRKARGRVVNIGSIGDRLSLPFGAPLASSKWAIASITESLRLELRPWGIRVVLIEPASIHTDAVNKVEDDAARVVQQMTDQQSDHYKSAYLAMTGRALQQERKGSDPEVVAAAILRALGAKRPRTRYLVGKDSRRLAFLARWAPDPLFDWIRIRIFGLPRKFGGAINDQTKEV